MGKKLAFCGAVVMACLSVAAFAGAPGGGGGAPGGGGPGMAGGPGGPGGGGMRGGRGGAGGTPAGLGPAMQDMGRTLGRIKSEAPDPTKMQDALKDIVTFERDVAIASLGTPPKLNNLPDDKKASETEAFHTMLRGLMHTLLDLEDAVVAKKSDDITKLLAKLDDIQKQGHSEFR